ncbi:uncharacterized protein METZ01_LOCUS467234, partial [marine metagenome]
KKAYNENGLISEAWKQARRWVIPQLGLDTDFFTRTSGLHLSDMYGFNHVRTENTDKLAGAYSVNETWVISSGNVFEDFTVDTSTSAETGQTTVGINGTITGLDTTSSTNFEITESKWDAASAKFDSINPVVIFDRATSYSGVTALNYNALSTSIGRNPNAGTINYNYSYDDSNAPCISSEIPGGWVAKSESMTISDTHAKDMFATLPVLGRNAGPILQDLNTVSETTRSLSINLTVPASGICPKTTIK